MKFEKLVSKSLSRFSTNRRVAALSSNASNKTFFIAYIFGIQTNHKNKIFFSRYSRMTYYAALVPVVQLLGDICRDDPVRYPNFSLGKQQITKSLHEKFTLVQKLLDDNYYFSSNGEAFDNLERRIRDVTYRAQDIIESQISIEKTQTFKKFIQKLFHGKNPKRQPDHEGLQLVEEEVDSILVELARIKESNIKDKDFAAGSSSKSQVDDDYVDIDGGSKQAPPAGSTTMVGFDEHLIAIKEQLCGGSYQLQTIPITGMGGIGKTTLARNIFDDKLIVENFDIRIWVTVSQDYRIEKMFRSILDSIKGVTPASSDLREVSTVIHKQLINRRYLIVVDDIWSTNVLDDIKRISPENNCGSRIMITTRLSDVAVYANKFGSPLHQIQSLNKEQSWRLFREKVFAQEGCVCPPELEDLGKAILRNCKGLPLAIVVIAGVLSKVKRTRTDWNEILSNVTSVVSENDEHFSRILSLSYNHLPHHLKSCFLYIGGFPEDHKISVSKLIKLWMAEGFLNSNPVLIEESSSKRKTLEEVGEEYLEDLINRNLILITKKTRYNGRIEFCGIHDLLRDLCQQRVRNENFFHFTDNYGKLPEDGENDVRRACLYPYNNDSYNNDSIYEHHQHPSSSRLITEAVPHSTALSILCFGNYILTRNMNISLGFKLLRVLDALDVIVSDSFPDKLLELFHLRYLALYLLPESSTETVIRISPSISQLHNLQTFIVTLHRGVDVVSLPSEMWKMAQLRHVMIDRLEMPPPPLVVFFFEGIWVLENLQTLSGLVDYRFTEEAIVTFPNLKILKVAYDDPMNAKWELLNNLSNLNQLVELDIDLGYTGDHFPTDYNNFAFPLNLKRLSLSKRVIPWKGMSTVGCLPNLEALEIKDFNIGLYWEPREGEFQSLKYLLIHTNSIEYWGANDTHFPRLEHLKLEHCFNLEEIPPEIGDIPTLQLIEVIECCDLATNSARQLQQQQDGAGNDTLQFKIVNIGTLDWGKLLYQGSVRSGSDERPKCLVRTAEERKSFMSRPRGGGRGRVGPRPRPCLVQKYITSA